MGLVPPLRVVWYATAGLAALLVAYVWLLVAIKHRALVDAERESMSPQDRAAAFAARHALETRNGRRAESYEALRGLSDHDRVHVVVRPASELAG
jgi:hypothetical protein